MTPAQQSLDAVHNAVTAVLWLISEKNPWRVVGGRVRATFREVEEKLVDQCARRVAEFVVSIEGLSSGSHLTVGDIPLPEGVEAAVALDVVVVSVGQAPVQDLGDEPEAAAAEGAVAGE